MYLSLVPWKCPCKLTREISVHSKIRKSLSLLQKGTDSLNQRTGKTTQSTSSAWKAYIPRRISVILTSALQFFFFFQNQKSLQSRLLVQKRNFWVEKNTWEIHTDTHTHTYVGVHTHTWIYTFWTSISRVGFRI